MLLTICEGYPLLRGGFLSQRTSNMLFDVFFGANLNKLLNKSNSRWFGTPRRSFDFIVM